MRVLVHHESGPSLDLRHGVCLMHVPVPATRRDRDPFVTVIEAEALVAPYELLARFNLAVKPSGAPQAAGPDTITDPRVSMPVIVSGNPWAPRRG